MMPKTLVCSVIAVAALAPLALQAQQPQSVPRSITGQFEYVNRKVLEMAKDFPADKYSFRLKPEMRSFGEVIVHVASGVVYAAKAGRGEKAKWDELAPKDYPTKAACVALMEKSFADADAVLKGEPAAGFTRSVEPWLDVLEHSAEHYGLLVAYYRANGLVPPESRPKPGK